MCSILSPNNAFVFFKEPLTFVDINTIKKLESTMQEALSLLQEQVDDQSLELEATELLRDVLKRTKIVLEKNFKDHVNNLSDDQVELQKQMKRLV